MVMQLDERSLRFYAAWAEANGLDPNRVVSGSIEIVPSRSGHEILYRQFDPDTGVRTDARAPLVISPQDFARQHTQWAAEAFKGGERFEVNGFTCEVIGVDDTRPDGSVILRSRIVGRAGEPEPIPMQYVHKPEGDHVVRWVGDS